MSKEQSETKAPAEPGDAGYKPVGKVVTVSTNAKTGVRVLMDDKRVWKESGKPGKAE